MTEPVEPPPEQPDRSRFRTLPRRIPLDETVAGVEVEAAPDPTMGRDPERDFMLRNAGG